MFPPRHSSSLYIQYTIFFYNNNALVSIIREFVEIINVDGFASVHYTNLFCNRVQESESSTFYKFMSVELHATCISNSSM